MLRRLPQPPARSVLSALTDVILPIFAIVAIGWLAGRRRMLGESAAQAINGFVYYFALPAMLFVAMARTPVDVLLNLPFLGTFVGGYVATYLAALAIGLWGIGAAPSDAVLQAANASYANTGYVGIPLMFATFGAEGLAPGGVAAVISASFGLLLGVVSLEFAGRAGSGPFWRVALKVFATTARNPMLDAVLVGIVFSLSGTVLPKALESFGLLLGGAAAPGALFAIGLFLGAQPLRFELREIGWQVAMKACFQPAVTYALAKWVFALDAFWAAAAVLLSGLPVAATVFVLAQQYGHYQRATSSAILVSTIFAVPTMALAMLVMLPER